MDISRRNVLKGLAAISGLAAAIPSFSDTTGSAIRTVGSNQMPLHIIIDRAAEQSGFVEGVHVARYQGGLQMPLPLMHSVIGLAFVRDFQKLLGSSEALRVVGLVDDANAAIIISLARTAGVQLHWLGQHQATTGKERHTVMAATEATTWEQLALQLQDGKAPANWPMRLGYALTALDRTMPDLSQHSFEHLNKGSFVSFAFDTQGNDNHG